MTCNMSLSEGCGHTTMATLKQVYKYEDELSDSSDKKPSNIDM